MAVATLYVAPKPAATSLATASIWATICASALDDVQFVTSSQSQLAATHAISSCIKGQPSVRFKAGHTSASWGYSGGARIFVIVSS